MAELQGLLHAEEVIDSWHQEWGEITDVHLDGECNADEVDQQERGCVACPLPVGKRCFFILEFTWPNYRVQGTSTDTLKTE
jgi:hypothetical protein